MEPLLFTILCKLFKDVKSRLVRRVSEVIRKNGVLVE